MKTIKTVFWSTLLLLTGLWWLSDPPRLAQLAGFFDWRNVLTQYTGILGIGVMSLAVILAVRPALLERACGGLDQMYRLHKWLGIAGLVISLSHWLIAQGPKWAVALGWLERRGRKARPILPEGSLQQLFAEQRGLAEGVGEWAFYGALLLMVLALVRTFPYRRFFQTHRLLAVAYLALVFHAVILVKFSDWQGPIGVTLVPLLILGSGAAVMALFRKRAGGTVATGRVVALERFPDLEVLAVDIRMAQNWPGHKPGQFAFVTFHADEGPHPFTIASTGDDGTLRFLVKALGDYTGSLPGRLKIGDPVTLEGPYGCFDFEGPTRRQIWIGGGIGITPFIARLQALAGHPDGRTIDLFHTTAVYDPRAIDRLTAAAEAATVRLHVLWDARDGHLDADRLTAAVPDWRNADVWFCGPVRFGTALRQALTALGLAPGRFHQELFTLR